MQFQSRTGLILGTGCILAALLVAFVWVPLDTTTGLIEKVRRQVTIGDSLAPTLAAFFVLLGGILVLVESTRRSDGHRITQRNVLYLLGLLAIIAVSFALMRWSGPLIAGLLTEEGYRVLRDTAPWKYIGFVAGGTALVTGLISMVDGRVSRRAIILGVLATLAMIVIYDLPFDDLILPPNGDV